MRVRWIRSGFVAAAAALTIAADPSGADDFVARERIVEGLVPVTGDATDTRHQLDLHIQFALGSADLDSTSLRQLDALAAALKAPALRDARIAIHGHTDASGNAELNLELSRERARSVRDYLVDRGGVAAGRLEIRGFGERRLLAPSRPEAAVNRRVTVVNLDAESGGASESGGEPHSDDGGTTAITGE